MMKYIPICIAIFTACFSPAIRAATNTVEQQSAALSAAVRSVRNTPEARALLAEIRKLEAERERVENELPGMQKINSEITAARRNLRRLQSKRNAILRANTSVLKLHETRLAEAEAAYRRLIRNNPRVKYLLNQRRKHNREMTEQDAEK